MTGIRSLIARDIRHATMNVVAVMVVLGLTMLPSLFTWFNVLASWNPFGNTRNLTVAVANTDEGYQGDISPLPINIGDQVVSALRANNDLNWVVTSEDEAIDGTRSGKYYAAIVMPPEFSRTMMTFYSGDDADPTRITYYTNEKKNALAPKITGQGADEVSSQINATFSRTLSEVALNLVNNLADYLNSSDSQAALVRLESHVGQSATQLRTAADTADMFTALIESSQALVTSAADLAADTGRTADGARQTMGDAATSASTIADTFEQAAGSLATAVDTSASSYRAAKDSIDEVYSATDTQAGDQVAAIGSVRDQVQAQIDRYQDIKNTLETEVRPVLPESAGSAVDQVDAALDQAIDRQTAARDGLDQAADQLGSANSDAQATHAEVDKLLDEATDAVEEVRDSYQENLRPDLAALAATLDDSAATLSSIGSDLSAATADLGGSSSSVNGQLDQAKQTTADLADSLREAADTLGTLETSLAKIGAGGDLSDLETAIGGDPDALAASLGDPVAVNRIPVFPVASFGSAMTPLYTVLALWVGALLLSVSVKTEVPDDILPGGPPLKLYQKYLGRYGIFFLIGFLQSTVQCVGTLLFVDIQAVHPWLFMLAGWVTSLVFTFIVYTSVAAFGSAGKALSVLLLVIQISGAGGAYPLEMLPDWFSRTSPYLPATHAITAFRAAIAGVYQADYWIALGKLTLFTLPMLLLGLVLRKPLIAFNEKFLAKVQSTKLI